MSNYIKALEGQHTDGSEQLNPNTGKKCPECGSNTFWTTRGKEYCIKCEQHIEELLDNWLDQQLKEVLE